MPASARLLAEGTGADPGALELSDRFPGGASRETFLVEAGRRAAGCSAAIRAGAQDSFAPARGGVRAWSSGGRRRGPGRRGRSRSSRRRAVRRAPATLMDHVDGDVGGAAGAAARGAGARPRARCRPSSARRWPGSTRSTPGPSTASPRRHGDPALAACELWEADARRDRRAAAGRRGRAALAAAQPAAPADARALVHGDFRLGNLIVDERGLAAVIDWELCHVGRSGRGPRLAVHPLVAVRQRRSPGRRGRERWTSSSTPTRRPGASRPRPGAAPLVGGDGQRQVGGDLRPPGARPPDRAAAVGRSWRRSDGGSASPSGTCWNYAGCLLRIASGGARVWQDGGPDAGPPDGARAARRDGGGPATPRSASGCRASGGSRSWCSPTSARSSRASFAPGRSRRGEDLELFSRSERRRPPRRRARARAATLSSRAIRRGELDERLRRRSRRLREHVARKLEVARPGTRSAPRRQRCCGQRERVQRRAAVDPDRLAGDVAGLLRGQVGDQRRRPRRARPSGPVGHRVVAAGRGSRPASPAPSRSRPCPGSTALAVIPRRDVLGGDRLHHPEQPGLRGGVGDLARAGPSTRRAAGDHDDPPAAALAHPGQAGLDDPEGAGQVDVDVALPLLGASSGGRGRSCR